MKLQIDSEGFDGEIIRLKFIKALKIDFKDSEAEKSKLIRLDLKAPHNK